MKIDLQDYFDSGEFQLKEILLIMKNTKWVTTGESPTTLDDGDWYSISARAEVSSWIRETFPEERKNLWFELESPKADSINISRFDVHETIHTLLLLRWPIPDTSAGPKQPK